MSEETKAKLAMVVGLGAYAGTLYGAVILGKKVGGPVAIPIVAAFTAAPLAGGLAVSLLMPKRLTERTNP